MSFMHYLYLKQSQPQAGVYNFVHSAGQPAVDGQPIHAVTNKK